jgi:hypothetical protein
LSNSVEAPLKDDNEPKSSKISEATYMKDAVTEDIEIVLENVFENVMTKDVISQVVDTMGLDIPEVPVRTTVSENVSRESDEREISDTVCAATVATTSRSFLHESTEVPVGATPSEYIDGLKASETEMLHPTSPLSPQTQSIQPPPDSTESPEQLHEIVPSITNSPEESVKGLIAASPSPNDFEHGDSNTNSSAPASPDIGLLAELEPRNEVTEDTLALPEAQRVAEGYKTTDLIFALPTKPATAPALSFDFHGTVELGLLVTNNKTAEHVPPMSPAVSIEASNLDGLLKSIDRSPHEKQAGPTELPLIPPQLSSSISNKNHSTQDGVEDMLSQIASSPQVQTELHELVPNSLVPVELEHISKEPDNVVSKLMIGLEPLTLLTKPDKRLSRSPSTDEIVQNSTESAGEISSLSSEHSGTLSERSRSPSIPQTLASTVSPILDQRTIASPIPGLPWQALQRTSSHATISAPIPKIYIRLPRPVITAPVPVSTSQQLSARPGSQKLRRKSPSTLVIVPPPIQTSTPRSTSSIQSSAQSPKDKSQTSSPTLPVKIKLKFHEPPSPESPPPFKRQRKVHSNSIIRDKPEPVIFDCIVVRNDFENVHYLLLEVR